MRKPCADASAEPILRPWVAAACAAVLLGASEEGERASEAGARPAVELIGAAWAQQSDRVVPPGAGSGTIAKVDETFALYAASSSLAEIEGAQLVLKTSKRDEVREYAEQLVREHGKALEELRRLLAPHGLKLPAAATGRHADLVTKLTGIRPADRDDAFLLRFGLDAHKETIALFERHAAEGRDPRLKQYARQTLPMLREHMAAAQKLIHAAGAAR